MTTDLRNLPAEVLARLDAHDQSVGIAQRGRTLEHVPFKPELRRNDDGTVTIDGYATVYDYPYDVAGGAPYGWSETIARGAADKSVRERDDVRFLVNHDGLALARTRSRTLKLESDDTGLRIEATLDERSPEVLSLVSAMERGDIDEMSFAFRALRQEWNDDYSQRTITEVKLYDVSAVTYPANPATVMALRSEPPAVSYPLSLALAEAEQIRLRTA
jgi:HK97 family phage prohead protease